MDGQIWIDLSESDSKAFEFGNDSKIVTEQRGIKKNKNGEFSINKKNGFKIDEMR